MDSEPIVQAFAGGPLVAILSHNHRGMSKLLETRDSFQSKKRKKNSRTSQHGL